MGGTKFNDKVLLIIVDLCFKGFSDYEIAKVIGISDSTLYVWKSKYPYLKKAMNNAKNSGATGSIERGLRVLSEGSEQSEYVEKYIEKRKILDDETGEEFIIPVEITKKRKKLPPDPKAIEILARKYDKEFGKEEVTNNTINLLEGFTMRDLQDSISLDNPIDAGAIEIDSEYLESREEN